MLMADFAQNYTMKNHEWTGITTISRSSPSFTPLDNHPIWNHHGRANRFSETFENQRAKMALGCHYLFIWFSWPDHLFRDWKGR